MRIAEKRMPAAVVGVLLAATVGLLVILGGGSAQADPDGPVPNPGHAWTSVQGHGDDADGVYVSTQSDEAFEVRVNGSRALRLEPGATSPNVIGGYSGNSVTAGAEAATICGGGAPIIESTDFSNTVTDDAGTIGGGRGNQAGDAAGTTSNAPDNTVGGGSQNVASGSLWSDPYHFGGATVGGGYDNDATSYGATVGGGWENTASGGLTTVCGGTENTASSGGDSVGGGVSNDASGGSATVGGGANNTASGVNATVGGGAINDASAGYATVGGGNSNDASGGYATIAGGWNNTASNGAAAVGGGVNNIAGDFATVAGGRGNDAAAQYATIAGGGPSDPISNPSTTNNVVSDDYGTIGGGGNNQAGDAGGTSTDATYATVGGGSTNTASSPYATVAGGLSNTASGWYSFAAGRRAIASNIGCFVWGDSYDGDVTCSTNDRWVTRARGGYYLYTNSGLTNLCKLDAGGGNWACSSDRGLKENFTAVDGQAVLASVAEMPITTWNMKDYDPSIRHMGPVAQDFYGAFGLGQDDLTIASGDTGGVALAAIQGLYELSQEQDARIDALEARVAALETGAPVEREAPADSGSESLASSMMPTGWLLLAGLFVLGGLVVVQRRLAGGR